MRENPAKSDAVPERHCDFGKCRLGGFETRAVPVAVDLNQHSDTRNRRSVSTRPLSVSLPRHLPDTLRLRLISGSYRLRRSYRYQFWPICLISVLAGLMNRVTYSGFCAGGVFEKSEFDMQELLLVYPY